MIRDKSGVVDENNYNYSFYYNKKHIIRFDIKQLISHFLGITAGVLEGRVKDRIRFVYFIFNPQKLNNEALNKVYRETIEEIGKLDISELFNAVFEFQTRNLKIVREMPKFEFVVADQNNVVECIKAEN